MMVPKIYFGSSIALHCLLDRKDITLSKIFELLKKSERFINLVREHRIKVFKKIKKYLGVKWARECLEVYIFDANHTSMSPPLMIKYRKDFYTMFYTFMHELVHVFFMSKDFSKIKQALGITFKEEDVYVELIVQKVFMDIFWKRRMEKTYAHLVENDVTFTAKWVREKVQKLVTEYDLNKKPLIFYLQQRLGD